MAACSDLEKIEQPSPWRLEQARDEGRTAHSRELANFVLAVS